MSRSVSLTIEREVYVVRLQQERFKIFVSHKHADADLANVVAEELEGLAPGLIECWVSGQDLTAGVDWNRQIKAGLAASHLLVLLFTTPAQKWDWCLYEVGLFIRFDEDDITSVVCLFDPEGTTPGPLNQVQGVAAEPGGLVDRFLLPLCTETWRVSDDWHRGALLAEPDQKQLAGASQRIANAFRKSLDRSNGGRDVGVYKYRPCHTIVLDLENVPYDKDWVGIPNDARIVQGDDATSSYTLSLFRVHQRKGERKWGELVAEIEGTEAPWLRDLDSAFIESLREHLWAPSNEKLEAWHPGSDERHPYLPVLYEVTRRQTDDRPVSATIILVPD